MTNLIGCECVRRDERSRPKHDDSENVVDHRRQVLPHELSLGRDERKQQSESSSQSTERLRNFLANERLLGDLSFESDAVGL